MGEKFPKVLFDEPNGIIRIDDHDIKCVTKAEIKVGSFGKPSEVTITFRADVTLIPPDREKIEAEMESKIKSKHRFKKIKWALIIDFATSTMVSIVISIAFSLNVFFVSSHMAESRTVSRYLCPSKVIPVTVMPNELILPCTV